MLRELERGACRSCIRWRTPTEPRPLRLYGENFRDDEKLPIPAEDVPAGTPDWMRLNDGWADRPGTGLKKRATITVTVPREFLP